MAQPQYGALDPDSYHYFWYYHLYPRTLAAANQRLGNYGAPYGYGFGYNGPFYPAPYGYFRPSINR